MRLVRDYDVELMEEPHVQAEDTDRLKQDATLEEPDGAIDDSADSSDESSSDVQLDLRTLEALLFSTHHPLTAGRLAELILKSSFAKYCPQERWRFSRTE